MHAQQDPIKKWGSNTRKLLDFWAYNTEKALEMGAKTIKIEDFAKSPLEKTEEILFEYLGLPQENLKWDIARLKISQKKPLRRLNHIELPEKIKDLCEKLNYEV